VQIQTRHEELSYYQVAGRVGGLRALRSEPVEDGGLWVGVCRRPWFGNGRVCFACFFCSQFVFDVVGTVGDEVKPHGTSESVLSKG